MGRRWSAELVALVPPAAMAIAAAWVLLRAGRGGFASMMGFPLVFAAITSGVAVVSWFVGRRAGRRLPAALLTVAALLGWGATLSHHAWFERERREAEQEGRTALVGADFASMPFLHALNTGADPEVGLPLTEPHALVNVWAPWCSPCVQEIPLLETFWQRHRETGFQLVGVTRLTASDAADRAAELESIEAFLHEHGVSYPILVVDDAVYDRLRPRRLPTSLWLENGAVRDYRVTVDGTLQLLEAIEARLGRAAKERNG